tara:strand:+ start:3948 stop:4268 length:321 start_codon:yes stop_codon:yes gene_type:complete
MKKFSDTHHKMNAEEMIKGEDCKLICILLILSCTKEVDIMPFLKPYFSNIYSVTHSDKYIYKEAGIRRKLRTKFLKTIMNWDYTAILIAATAAITVNSIYEKVINS